MGIFKKLFNLDVKEESEQYVNNNSEKFEMIVEDIFSILGRGIVVTGKIISGSIKINDEIKINNSISAKVKDIEMFRKKLDEAKAGDNVGLILENIEKNQINQGDILTK